MREVTSKSPEFNEQLLIKDQQDAKETKVLGITWI